MGKLIFSLLFFEPICPLDIHFPTIKFHTLIENIYMEGTVSQILYLVLSFNFMKFRKMIMKKYKKSSRFFT